MALHFGTKIGIGFSLAIATAVAVMGFALTAFEDARLETNSVRSKLAPQVNYASRMLGALERMENAEFLYFFPGAKAQDYKQFDQNAAEFGQEMRGASQLAAHADERTTTDLIARHYHSLLVVDGQIRELLQEGEIDEASRVNLTTSLAEATTLRDLIRHLRTVNLAEIEAAQVEAEKALSDAERSASLAAILGAFLTALTWWRMRRDVVAPMLALESGARDIADGVFRTVDHPSSAATIEIRELEKAFNLMAMRLQASSSFEEQARNRLEDQVTERTQDLRIAKEDLEDRVAELRTVDKLKSNFMAVMSHELLTPINFITGFSSALEEGALGPLQPDQLRAVRRIDEGATRLTRMVRNVLDFTGLESGRTALCPQSVDYANLAEEVVDGMRTQATLKEQRLEMDAPAECPSVWADPSRVAQILTEVLDNALKFTQEGGRIVLKIRVVDDQVVTIVEDTGVGIPERSLRDVFKPFFQADFSSTRRHGGMGLGLAIVYRLVVGMGGDIRVDSRHGVGTSVRFTLPIWDSRNVVEVPCPPESTSV